MSFPAYTDYPFPFLGDIPGRLAPIRRIEVLSYDGDKYCQIMVEGQQDQIKAGYIYENPARIEKAKRVPLSKLRSVQRGWGA